MNDTKTKHTPGPWEVSKDAVPEGFAQFTVYAESDGNRVATAFQSDANACLIAAAPELLEALKAFDHGLRDGSIKWARPRRSDSDPYHPANTLMCKAFAKAEGWEA